MNDHIQGAREANGDKQKKGLPGYHMLTGVE